MGSHGVRPKFLRIPESSNTTVYSERRESPYFLRSHDLELSKTPHLKPCAKLPVLPFSPRTGARLYCRTLRRLQGYGRVRRAIDFREPCANRHLSDTSQRDLRLSSTSYCRSLRGLLQHTIPRVKKLGAKIFKGYVLLVLPCSWRGASSTAWIRIPLRTARWRAMTTSDARTTRTARGIWSRARRTRTSACSTTGRGRPLAASVRF